MKKITKIISKLTKNGFYIILFLCICAVGVSGYVMFSTPEDADFSADSIFEDASDAILEEIDDFQEPTQEVLFPEPIEIEEEPEEKPKEEKAAIAPTAKMVEKPAPKKEKIVYSMPLKGEISLAYSADELIKSKTLGDWRVHQGVDIAAQEGTKVHAIADGKVNDVYEDEMMGYTVVIEHDDGKVSTYSNLMKGIVVKKGDKIMGGDVIGGVGQSAAAECLEQTHLHLEITQDGKNIDPMSVIEK